MQKKLSKKSKIGGAIRLFCYNLREIDPISFHYLLVFMSDYLMKKCRNKKIE